MIVSFLMNRRTTCGELFLIPLVGQAAAAPCHICDGRARQRAEHSGGCGRVADAHFADADGGQSCGLRLAHRLNADRNGLHRLASQHGGLLCEVFRAVPDLPVAHGGAVRVGQNPNVGDDHFVAKEPGQRGHAGQAARHVDGLFARDRLRRAADALGADAVVRCEDEHAGAPERGPLCAEDAREADGNVLQPPEAVGRLGKACLPGLGGAHRRGVRGGDGVQKFK